VECDDVPRGTFAKVDELQLEKSSERRFDEGGIKNRAMILDG
jgi:hypothetical protein